MKNALGIIVVILVVIGSAMSNRGPSKAALDKFTKDMQQAKSDYIQSVSDLEDPVALQEKYAEFQSRSIEIFKDLSKELSGDDKVGMDIFIEETEKLYNYSTDFQRSMFRISAEEMLDFSKYNDSNEVARQKKMFAEHITIVQKHHDQITGYSNKVKKAMKEAGVEKSEVAKGLVKGISQKLRQLRTTTDRQAEVHIAYAKQRDKWITFLNKHFASWKYNEEDGITFTDSALDQEHLVIINKMAEQEEEIERIEQIFLQAG